MFFLRKLNPLNRLHYCRQSLPDFITKNTCLIIDFPTALPVILYIYIKVSSFGYSGRCIILHMNFVLLKGSNSCLYTLKFPSHACFHYVFSQISNQCYSHYARIRSNQHKPTIYKPTPRSDKGCVNDRSNTLMWRAETNYPLTHWCFKLSWCSCKI